MSFQPRAWLKAWAIALGGYVRTRAHNLSALFNVFKINRPKGREGNAMKNTRGTSGATSRGIWNKIKTVALNVRATFVLVGVAISALLSACGGGDEFARTAPQPSVVVQHAEGNPFALAPVTQSTSPEVRRMKALALATPNATPYGEATPEDAATQLLDFAEKNYSQFFPAKKETLTWWRYTYRYYQETGVYVGVATGVTQGDNLVEGGVYVMGGPFGNAPTYVGQLNQFITPYKILRYTNKVYALWTANWPMVITKTGATWIANKTSIPGVLAYVNCELASKPLPDGKILARCVDNVMGTGRHVLYIHPVLDEMYDHVGEVPSDIVWVSSTQYDPATPNWWAKAKISDGWFFTSNTVTWVLKFQDDATKTVMTVKAGTFGADGTIKALLSYSN